MRACGKPHDARRRTFMAEHPNVARLRKGFQIRTEGKFGEEELAFLEDLFDDDIFWHGSGHGQFATGAQGRDNVFAMFGKVTEETSGTFTMIVDDIYADDFHGIVNTHVIADRGPLHHEWKEVDIFHLTPEGRVKDFWGIPDDQDALDAFFNADVEVPPPPAPEPEPVAAVEDGGRKRGFEMENDMHFSEPIDVVFDFLSDDRNEALWEPPNVSKIDKTSPGPVGVGTTFVGLYEPRDYEMHVTIVEYDRPHLVARTTEGTQLSIGIRLQFSEADDGGTDVHARWQVEPKGWMRGMGLVVERAFRKQLDQREAQIARGIAKRVVRVD
jgi:uncharacterized protein